MLNHLYTRIVPITKQDRAMRFAIVTRSIKSTMKKLLKWKKILKKIQSLIRKRKRKEEAEAAILAAKKAAEAEQAARDAAAAALAEAQRIQNISINQEQKAKQHSDVQAMQIETETNNGNKILTENEKSNIPSQTETSSSIKIEQNVFMKSEQTESNVSGFLYC